MANTTAPTTSSIEIGDIFCSSWGYEQTNIDFFEVVAKTPKTLKLRLVKAKKDYCYGYSGLATPIKGSFADDKVYSRKYDEGNKSVKIDYVRYSTLWDGQPELFSTYA